MYLAYASEMKKCGLNIGPQKTALWLYIEMMMKKKSF